MTSEMVKPRDHSGENEAQARTIIIKLLEAVYKELRLNGFAGPDDIRMLQATKVRLNQARRNTRFSCPFSAQSPRANRNPTRIDGHHLCTGYSSTHPVALHPGYRFRYHDNNNTSSLKSAHIISGTFPPRGHPLRRILAAACVYGLWFMGHQTFKFAQEAEDHPTLAADLLRDVELALDTTKVLKERAFIFKDPVDNEEIRA
ncbi:uncharacterized protein N7525_010872 [Penicillium rubens]|nr:uncharacterized protein N7525_010872 [Penicillium rubens]KAJ5821588.1 hypothetical protein N7525_010872 [Penicillium rubens]